MVTAMIRTIGTPVGMADTVSPPPPELDGDKHFRDVERLFVYMTGVADDHELRRCRRQIITRCLPLADAIAWRYHDRGEPHDDLTQVARLGLIRAVIAYQPEKGRFVAFAVPTIVGELRRYFRDNTWGMKVSRGVKDTHYQVRAAIEALSQRLRRSPTASELAAELGIHREQVMECLAAARAYQPDSLSAPTTPGSDPQWATIEKLGLDEPGYNAVEDALVVAELVNELSDRERDIVRMRFCDSMTQTQIAQRMGISQVHVSRLLAATLERLRTQLLDDTPAPKVLQRG